MRQARSKYGNTKVTDPNTGEVFESKKEYKRWLDLKLLVKSGDISNLRRQVEYELQEKFIDSTGKMRRAIFYVADFEYTEHGKTVIEDTKGYATDMFKLKEKLFRYRYPFITFHVLK